jgi:hypothetical protein
MTKTQRRAILARSGGCCERCGATEKSLVVHHDEYREDDSESIVRAICRPCHSAEHRQRPELRQPPRVPGPSAPMARTMASWRKRVERTCLYCGQKFTALASARYCRRVCRQQAYRARKRQDPRRLRREGGE